MDDKKVIDHPTSRLKHKVEEQDRKIRELSIDVMVLRDLLTRTVRLLALQDIKNMQLPETKKRI